MLCGEPPFYDEDNFVLYEEIKKGEYDMEAPGWKEVSDAAKDLISKILVVDPSKRISVELIMEHPWVLSQKL